jgi:type I site-specific restriction endonuclease
MVAAELSLILELQTDEYWQDITVPMLETVRRRLRHLIKLIECKKRSFVYVDFEDEIGAGADIEVTEIPVGTDMDRFRAKARLFLKANQNHLAVGTSAAKDRSETAGLGHVALAAANASRRPDSSRYVRARRSSEHGPQTGWPLRD